MVLSNGMLLIDASVPSQGPVPVPVRLARHHTGAGAPRAGQDRPVRPADQERAVITTGRWAQPPTSATGLRATTILQSPVGTSRPRVLRWSARVSGEVAGERRPGGR